MKTKKQIELSRIQIVLISLILFHNVPFVGYHTPAAAFGLIMLLTYVFLVRDVFVRLEIKLSEIFSVLCLTGMACIANIIFANENMFVGLYGFLQTAIYPIVGLTLLRYNARNTTKVLFWIYLLTTLITAITTFTGNTLIPNASRMLASTDRIKESGLESIIYNLNIGGFSFVYGCALVSPLFIYMWREKTINMIISTGAIIILGSAVLASNYTMAIMLFAFSLILFFVPNNYGTKQFSGTIILLFVFFIVNSLFVAQLLEYVASQIGDESIASRLNDLAASISGNDHEVDTKSDFSERKNAYMLSLESFLMNPLGAWSLDKLGGHSYIFDAMGRFGVIGFFLLIVVYKNIYRYFINPFKSSKKYGFALFCFVTTIITELVNPQPNLMYITFVFPLIWRYSQTVTSEMALKKEVHSGRVFYNY